ncbi:MAG: hypothetical protein MJ252_27580 [archaeon]|nr:hypothetical protein [archaeon]
MERKDSKKYLEEKNEVMKEGIFYYSKVLLINHQMLNVFIIQNILLIYYL